MRDGWRRVTLGEVATLDIERVPVRPGEAYRIAGVLNAGQGVFARPAIDGAATNYSALHRLRAGQLVMRKLTAWEGPITTVPREFEGFVVSPEFPTYTLSDDLDSRFMSLVCQLPSFWDAMRLRSTGTVQRRKRVNPYQLLNVEIDLPPLVEQRRFVDMVASVDDLREREREQIRASTALRDALLGELLVMRDGWRVAPLGDVAEVVGGSTPRTNQPAFWGGGIPWVTPSEVVACRGGTLMATLRTLTPEGLRSIGGRLLPVGTVLLTSRATIGAVALAGVPVAVNQGFGAMVVGPDLDARFLLYWCEHNTAEFTTRAGGSTFPEISKPKIRSIPIAVPPLDEQHRIVDLISAVDSVKDRALEALSRTDLLRGNLLGDLLSGDHEIPAAYDRFLDGAA